MPYKSKAQQRYMHAQHPDIAKRFDKETPNFSKLPERLQGKAAAIGAALKKKMKKGKKHGGKK